MEARAFGGTGGPRKEEATESRSRSSATIWSDGGAPLNNLDDLTRDAAE